MDVYSVCVYMYVYLHIYIYICVCVCIYIYKHIHMPYVQSINNRRMRFVHHWSQKIGPFVRSMHPVFLLENFG